MTTTKAKKPLSIVEPSQIPVNGLMLALNENALRAVSVFTASLMFSQPQFAAQTNPTNIIGLADMMYKYMQGSFVITQPNEKESAEPMKYS